MQSSQSSPGNQARCDSQATPSFTASLGLWNRASKDAEYLPKKLGDSFMIENSMQNMHGTFESDFDHGIASTTSRNPVGLPFTMPSFFRSTDATIAAPFVFNKHDDEIMKDSMSGITRYKFRGEAYERKSEQNVQQGRANGLVRNSEISSQKPQNAPNFSFQTLSRQSPLNSLDSNSFTQDFLHSSDLTPSFVQPSRFTDPIQQSSQPSHCTDLGYEKLAHPSHFLSVSNPLQFDRRLHSGNPPSQQFAQRLQYDINPQKFELPPASQNSDLSSPHKSDLNFYRCDPHPPLSYKSDSNPLADEFAASLSPPRFMWRSPPAAAPSEHAVNLPSPPLRFSNSRWVTSTDDDYARKQKESIRQQKYDKANETNSTKYREQSTYITSEVLACDDELLIGSASKCIFAEHNL
jgi:hypothetical protein